MNNVEYQMRQLIREIKRSNIYNQFRRLQMKIDKNEELSARVNAFRRESFTLQNTPAESETLNRLEALNREYEDILRDPDVLEFLAAEQGLAAMMNRLTDQIFGSLDLDISFLDE